MGIYIPRFLRDLRDVVIGTPADNDVLTYDAGTDTWGPAVGGAGGGAPTTSDYLVGTAQAGLSAEIVVGATPGGELGGTWAAPTVDATHSGSSHAAVQTAAEATAAAALSAHLSDATDAHDASAISSVAAGGLAATDVQAALNELDTEKATTATTVMDGDAAGGVLAGTYPSPSFAVDMATQGELDAHINDATDAHDASAISILDAAADFTATEVEGALAELQTADEADEAALAAHLADTVDAHDASAVSVVPFSTIAASTVQAALEEIVAEATVGAPSTADYLVGTAQGGLSAEIVVGATPGGELGNTWASPTVDATHSGSSHAGVQAAAEATAAAALAAHLAADVIDGDAAGGVLSGTYPNPGFAADMATQAELDAHVTDASDAHDASAISIADAGGDFTATDVEGALDELQADHETDAQALADHLTDATDAHDASAVSVVSTTLSGTGIDVQAVFEEIDNLLDDHSSRHENGGADEISIAGLDGTSTELAAHLADATDAHDASAISILDAAADFTATEVEGALAELQTADEADEAALAAHISDSSAAHAASAISVDSTTLVGTGTDVQAVFEELDNGIADHLADASDAHDASAISFVPTGSIAATDVQAAIAEVASMEYESRSSNTILGVADKGKTIDITATITQTFEADETLADGWWVILRNATDEGTAIITLDPAGTETIDGLTTVTMYSGEARLIVCNGAGGNFNSIMLDGGFARFTIDGNFIVPHGITQATVECIGAGGGGGGGRGGAAASTREGGSGGGGGARIRALLAASALGNPGDSIAVDVAAGGTSGAGGSSANGSNGGVGGDTTFGTFVRGGGGGPGFGGLADTSINSGGGGGGPIAGGVGANNAGGQGGGNIDKVAAALGGNGMGNAGANGGINGSASAEYGGGSGGFARDQSGSGGGSSVRGASGGGGGAGVTAANAESAGGVGGSVNAFVIGGSGAIAGGAAGAANGGAGTAGAAGTLQYCGLAGGGGGSQDSGTGGGGGNGGAPGGGAGGGGAGTADGGAGGVGGIGECRVWYS